MSLSSEDSVYLAQEPIGFPVPRVFLIGPSGSGKSAVGSALAHLSDIRVIDTDAVVLERTGYDTISALWESGGEPYFRAQELLCLDEIEAMSDAVVVATGGGLPAIPGVMDRISEFGVSVYLHASLESLWARLAGDLADRPLLKSGGPKALRKLIDQRVEVYNRADLAIDTTRLSVSEVARMLAAELSVLQEIARSDREVH